MKLLHQIILILELVFIALPVSFYLAYGLTFFVGGVLSYPSAENALVGLIAVLSAVSTLAVWYVTWAAIKKIHHQLQIANIWWGLVIMGFAICLLIVAALNTPGMEHWLGSGLQSKLFAFLLGLPLAVPAIHSMFVFRYAESAKRDRKGVLIPLPPTPPGIRVRTMAVTKSVGPWPDKQTKVQKLDLL